MIESHKRSIAKALSYRLMGTAVTFVVAWMVARDWSVATLIGLTDTIAKVGAFYFHERAWERIDFGRAHRTPE